MTTMADTLSDKLKADGYLITPPPDNTRGCTFEATKGSDCVAVLVKEHKAKVSVPTVQVFQEYLGLDAAKRYTRGGWLISASGFFNTALTHVKTEEPANLRLGTFSSGILNWDYGGSCDPASPAPSTAADQRRNCGTSGYSHARGVWGRRQWQRHLAGAFALMGFDVVLVDLDPDKNLRKLFLRDPQDEDGDASLYVPAKGRGTGTTITVLNHDQWNERHYPDIKIVVCDCSPVLSENPKELVSKFDYCIIPTTLNPLGVAKKADVITRTFGHIRAMNPEGGDVRPDQRLRRNTGRGENGTVFC